MAAFGRFLLSKENKETNFTEVLEGLSPASKIAFPPSQLRLPRRYSHNLCSTSQQINLHSYGSVKGTAIRLASRATPPRPSLRKLTHACRGNPQPLQSTLFTNCLRGLYTALKSRQNPAKIPPIGFRLCVSYDRSSVFCTGICPVRLVDVIISAASFGKSPPTLP